MRSLLFVLPLFLTFHLTAQTFITNVNIVDVEKQQLIPAQTVQIDGELITNIQPNKKIKLPANARIIDGTGKFLLPGLTDAHIHFFQNGGLYTRPDAIDLRKLQPHKNELAYAHDNMEKLLRRYLQHGITNLIDVGASYAFLQQSKQFQDKSFSPSIFITGPLLTTFEPPMYKELGADRPFSLIQSVEDAVKMVQEQLSYKPDFIKVWFITTHEGMSVEESARKNLPIVKAAIDEAHKNQLKVAIHTTQRIAAQLAVENGADYLVHSVDDEVIKDDFVQLLKKNKTVYCPTLIVHDNYMITFGQRHAFTTYELNASDAHQLGTLMDLKHIDDTALVAAYKKSSDRMLAKTGEADSIRKINLKKLSDAGITIVTGTDAGNIGTLHTSSYLNELKAMLASGMTNWQVLAASTINGAKVLNKEKEFGAIRKGMKANLILLNDNPVTAIENITKIDRIINKGTVFSAAELLQNSPEELAQQQLNAYNQGNIDAFLEPYAEDVELYDYPDKLFAKGKEAMRETYSKMFKATPDLHCELAGRIVQGNTVIDKEIVRFGKEKMEAVAIYHIENFKIKKVYFIQ